MAFIGNPKQCALRPQINIRIFVIYSPNISVIIPTFNRSHIIEQAINSVFAQTYQNFEIIVVDDGSTDGTRKLLQEKYSNRVNYYYQKNQGPSSARNLGLTHARGSLINFLDSDDYFLPNNLEEKAKILEKHPEIAWVYSDWYHLDSRKESPPQRSSLINKLKNKLLVENNIFDTLVLNGGGIMTMSTVLFRKKCIDVVGGFDEDLRLCEDLLLFIKVARVFKAKFIDKPLSVRTMQPDSLQESKIEDNENLFLFEKKMIQYFPEEMRRLKWPPRWDKWKANIFNTIGLDFLNRNQKNKARSFFLKSINKWPLQRKVYLLLLKTFIYDR